MTSQLSRSGMVLIAVLLLVASTSATQLSALVISDDWESGSIDPAKWTQHGGGAYISSDGFNSGHSIYFGSTVWGDVKSNMSYSFSDIQPELDFWAKTNGSSNWNDLGVSLEGPAGTSQTYLGIYIRPEEAWRKIECFAGEPRQYTTVPYPESEDNAWHHYSIVVNNDGTASFYKDGTLFWQSDPVDWNSIGNWQLRLSGYNYGSNIPVLDDVAIHNRKASSVAFDIKPGSCPNPLNIGPYARNVTSLEPEDNQATTASASYGQPQIRAPQAVLPGAILGTSGFNVADIDPATLRLAGVPVLRWSYEDVTSPITPDAGECACTTAGPDGYTDISLKFSRDDIVKTLGAVYDGEVLTLPLTGTLIDGTPIEGTDCVVIIAPKTQSANESNAVLVGNYPNPFNPTTEISFSLPNAGEVQLEVFNVLGQKVATLFSGHLEAGTHTVTWDASNQSSGIFLYRLEAGAYIETKKMLLLK